MFREQITATPLGHQGMRGGGTQVEAKAHLRGLTAQVLNSKARPEFT